MLKTPTKRVKGHPLQPCPLGIGFPLFQNHSKAEWDQFPHVLDLAGGFNPFEKYYSNWIISPGRGKNQKCLKPSPRDSVLVVPPFFSAPNPPFGCLVANRHLTFKCTSRQPYRPLDGRSSMGLDYLPRFDLDKMVCIGKYAIQGAYELIFCKRLVVSAKHLKTILVILDHLPKFRVKRITHVCSTTR